MGSEDVMGGERRPVRSLLRDRYVEAAVAILIFAAALRLFMLGARTFHFDEGQVMFFVHLAVENGEWSYSPALHGPLMFHAGSWILRNVGDAEVYYRLLSVVFGLGIVASPFFLRKEMGERGSLLAAALLATSPLMLYYTRFYRSDPTLLFFTAVTFVAAARYLRNRNSLYLPIMGLAVGFAATTKENFPVELGMVGVFLVVGLILANHRSMREMPGSWVKGFAGRLPWIGLGVVLGAAVFIFLYAPRPIVVADLPGVPMDILDAALDYWKEHSGGHEPYMPYYAVLFIIGEPLVLVAGLFGGYVGMRERKWFPAFLVLWTAVTYVVYSFSGDGRMPWLGLYMLFPLALLAGRGMDHMIRVWRESDRTGGRILMVGLVLLVAGHSISAVGGNYVWYDDPARIYDRDSLTSYEGNILVQWAQPTDEAGELITTLRGQAEERHEVFWRDLRIQTLSDDGLMHPMPWYLREYRNEERVNEIDGTPPAVLVPGNVEPDVRERLEGYRTVEGHLTPNDKLTLFYRSVEMDGG